MIFNIQDFKHVIGNLLAWFADPQFYMWDISWFRAFITDYLYHGGQFCNKHSVLRCKECKPDWTYKPDWELEIILNLNVYHYLPKMKTRRRIR